MHRAPCRLAFLLIPFALVCFALAPQARATCQDACLTNDNTVQGDDALISNTTGSDNTAIGFNALPSNTTANYNTAIAVSAVGPSRKIAGKLMFKRSSTKQADRT